MFVHVTTFTRLLALLFLGVGVAVSCGPRRVIAPPPGIVPFTIVRMAPANHSLNAAINTPIWAEFSEPIDPATVSERTVFLKHDDTRMPVFLSVNPTRTRLNIYPRMALGVGQPYTVEFSPAFRSSAGTELAVPSVWQFVTGPNVVIQNPFPTDGAADVSELTPLAWNGAVPLGTVTYDVYAGADSNSIAARRVPPMARANRGVFLRSTRWASGSTVYWSISATVPGFSQSIQGPVWQFRVLNPSEWLPDSLVLQASEWGWLDTLRSSGRCEDSTLWITPHAVTALRFPGLLASLRLSQARISLSPILPPGASWRAGVWLTLGPWDPCDLAASPAETDLDAGLLALAMGDGAGDPAVASSDRLGTHALAMALGFVPTGYLLRSSDSLAIATRSTSDKVPQLVLSYYRVRLQAARYVHGYRLQGGRGRADRTLTGSTRSAQPGGRVSSRR